MDGLIGGSNGTESESGLCVKYFKVRFFVFFVFGPSRKKVVKQGEPIGAWGPEGLNCHSFSNIPQPVQPDPLIQ